MDLYNLKLKKFMHENDIHGELLEFTRSCHTVEEAASAAGTDTDNCIKSICMIGKDGRLIVAIVCGDDRASASRVEKALKIERPKIAAPEEILEKTGYPCGGTPPFGYGATFLVDQRVMEKDIIFTGGGTPDSLVRISAKEMQKANNGMIARIRK